MSIVNLKAATGVLVVVDVVVVVVVFVACNKCTIGYICFIPSSASLHRKFSKKIDTNIAFSILAFI